MSANLLVIGFTVGLCLLVVAVLRSLQWLDDRAEVRGRAHKDRVQQQRADQLAIWSDDMQQREEGQQ